MKTIQLEIIEDQDHTETTLINSKGDKFTLSFVRGSFQASDLEYLTHSVFIPKVKEGMITESKMTILQSKLDELGVPWFDVGTDDMGFLVIGLGRRINFQQYETQLLEALNDL